MSGSSLSVNLQAEQFLAKLTGATPRLNAAVLAAVQRKAIEVQAAVKVKLSGGVLHVRTGTLRRSINQKVTQEGDSTTAVVGTNVKYAAVHEYGFTGDVTVPAHTRNNRRVSDVVTRKTKPGGAQVDVRAYVMHMHMPERSFLRSTLADFAPSIREDIRTAALNALVRG
jgi:phage gpG-like protein